MAEPQKPGSSPRGGNDAGAQRKAEEERQAAEKAAAEKRDQLGLSADATDEEVKEAEEAKAAAEKEREKAEEEPRFPVDELLDNARTLTGFSRHLLAGALSGEDRKTFTVAEAKAAAERFSKRKVGEEE